MTYRPVRPAQELKIHAAILRVVGERGLGRRPIDEVTTADVAAMAHAAWRTLPEARPVERAGNGRLPGDLRERAAALAPDRAAAGRVPVRPPAARKPLPAATETSAPPSARQKALQALRADPGACAILALLRDGHPDRVIADKLSLTKHQVTGKVRRWVKATDLLRRTDLVTWARRDAKTEAGQ